MELGSVSPCSKRQDELIWVTGLRLTECLSALHPLGSTPRDGIFQVQGIATDHWATAVQEAADALGLRLLPLQARDRTGIDAAFATAAQQGAGALLVSSDNFFAVAADQFAALEVRYRLPAALAVAGGLMSYGADLADQARQAGIYAGRILKGEKPADLPIIQPTKFEFVINLKTAKALGLTIPETLLATADEVIQ